MDATPSPSLATILSDQWRLLTFRATRAAVGVHWRRYLAYGLVVTWLAGVGRYWDNPRATLFQHAGLGSVTYVLVLAALLWLLLWPLRPQRWSYRNVLVFVTLTSLPALLYAIPVERFLSLQAAQDANVGFLAVVAAWRVALLFVFLRRVAAMSWLAVVVSTLLPLTLIVAALTALNLEHVVFDIMAGILPENASGNDDAYLVVLWLTFFSVWAFPVLLLAWGALVAAAQYRHRQARAG